MQRAWDLLADAEARTGQPLHSLLKIRVEFPDLDSAGLALALRRRSGREVEVARVRKLLHLARQRFIAGFVNEVAMTLGNPTDDQIEEELQSLGMLERCRDHLRRRRERRRPAPDRPKPCPGESDPIPSDPDLLVPAGS